MSRMKSSSISKVGSQYEATASSYDGHNQSKVFDSMDDANEWINNISEGVDTMAKKNEDTVSNGPAAQPQTDNVGNRQDVPKSDQSNTNSDSQFVEPAASEMTEQEAVNINSDVHAPVAQTNETDRIVTDGEKDQVAAGLHPKPHPDQSDAGDSSNAPDSKKQ